MVASDSEQQGGAQPQRRVSAARVDVLSALNSLAIRLNWHFLAHPQYPWMRCPSDERLRIAARYEPALGRGIPQERDHGNFAGSVMMLALLDPNNFGLRGGEALDVFGRTASLLRLQGTHPTSGRGMDNRRTNVIEAFLNEWQGSARAQEQRLRGDLLRAWKLVRLSIGLTETRQGFFFQTVSETRRAWYQCRVLEREPVDAALDIFDFVRCMINDATTQVPQILDLRAEDAELWGKIKDIFQVRGGASIVSTVWNALQYFGQFTSLEELLRLPDAPKYSRWCQENALRWSRAHRF